MSISAHNFIVAHVVKFCQGLFENFLKIDVLCGRSPLLEGAQLPLVTDAFKGTWSLSKV